MSMSDIRALFESAGQGRLKLIQSTLTYRNNQQVLSFAGRHADGTPFAFVSAPFPDDPVIRAQEIARDLIRLHNGQPELRARMSKLSAIAERISDKKRAHDKKADEYAERLDGIDAREVHAFAVGDAVLSERDTDLAQFESDMRQLSNLPLASAPSPGDSGKV